MSRRTLIGLIVPLVLIAAYFGVMSYIRAQVNDLIQHAVDQPLPQFTLIDRAGKQWSNKDLMGKRAVLKCLLDARSLLIHDEVGCKSRQFVASRHAFIGNMLVPISITLGVFKCLTFFLFSTQFILYHSHFLHLCSGQAVPGRHLPHRLLRVAAEPS